MYFYTFQKIEQLGIIIYQRNCHSSIATSLPYNNIEFNSNNSLFHNAINPSSGTYTEDAYMTSDAKEIKSSPVADLRQWLLCLPLCLVGS